jgi:hypothetical protein
MTSGVSKMRIRRDSCNASYWMRMAKRYTAFPPVYTIGKLHSPRNRIYVAELSYSYSELLLFAEVTRGIKHATVKDLIIDCLKLFSPPLLQEHSKKSRHLANRALATPKAQFITELYRSLYVLTGGRTIVHKKLSYTSKVWTRDLAQGRQS